MATCEELQLEITRLRRRLAALEKAGLGHSQEAQDILDQLGDLQSQWDAAGCGPVPPAPLGHVRTTIVGPQPLVIPQGGQAALVIEVNATNDSIPTTVDYSLGRRPPFPDLTEVGEWRVDIPTGPSVQQARLTVGAAPNAVPSTRGVPVVENVFFGGIRDGHHQQYDYIDPDPSVTVREARVGGRVVNVALLRYSWQTPAPGTVAPPNWDDATTNAIFGDDNGWSVADFWWRNTLGAVSLSFTLQPWRTLPGDQSKIDNDRAGVDRYIRDQAQKDGVTLSNYDYVCTIVQPPPGNRGAVSTPGDVVLDERPFSLEFFEHEFGHLLGFEHAFGRAPDGTWQAYRDDFDVMGYSQDNDHAIPAALTNLPASFWRSGRRLSAASLYRYVPEVAQSSSVVTADAGSTVRLTALTAARLGDPIIAVAMTPTGQITAEYRLQEEDDAGLPGPRVVLHSIGRRPMPAGAHEKNPVVYEADSGGGNSVATPEGDVTVTIAEVDQPASQVVLSFAVTT
jgi:hypothetical protein